MAFKNKIIHNLKTGQEIKFLQTKKDTGGQILEMETTYHAYSLEPAAHYHPHQAEEFRVLAGELTVRIDGELKLLKSGDTINIPQNKVHAMWNHTNNKTVVNWKVIPALNTEYFLETVTGLAQDGKTNKAGMPNILQVALLAAKYAPEFRLAKPPYAVQKILFVLLTPLAYLLGYRPFYRKYLD
ncbi:hypothetical protein AAE02nite_12080 [Adhaeribacter aerolatus]|uniref:Cupin type-2 domain-containing protein n=1 Tax=Adhaeribacter aerolatus TaxID=670289 RepID=A0A512AV01_9BACT|nr:cupin domain-containing protein [Adhaeribacter aerolatus]GEO03544.1 hypothetical protein AAE02nite_12080 [Adhaeribacter aerolatus]